MHLPVVASHQHRDELSISILDWITAAQISQMPASYADSSTHFFSFFFFALIKTRYHFRERNTL